MMLKKIFKGALSIAGLCAVAAGVTMLINRRIDRWETFAPDDAPDGDFVTLSDGARMHYVQRGDAGDAIILIHGLLGSTHEWFRNIDVLAQRYRVWAIDLIGFGYSSRVTDPTYSLKYYANALREFMDAQNIARATIAGHSMGGAVALEFAHAHPKRTHKLILIAPAAFLAKIPPALRVAAQVPFIPRALIGLGMTSAPARALAWRNVFGVRDQVLMDCVSNGLRTVRLRGTADAMVAMLASPHASDLTTGIELIATPALVLSGARDVTVPNWYCRALARKLPNADIITFKSAGHLPHVEFPDQVNRVLFEFLDQPDPHAEKDRDEATV